VVLSATESKF